jgi:phospholipase C
MFARGGRRRRSMILCALTVAGVGALAGGGAAVADRGAAGPRARAGSAAPIRTATPIKHVVVIIGQNHTFDNVFATYQPPPGQRVRNLRLEGIVTASGGPGTCEFNGAYVGHPLHRFYSRGSAAPASNTAQREPAVQA